jgi:hypothetical protein
VPQLADRLVRRFAGSAGGQAAGAPPPIAWAAPVSRFPHERCDLALVMSVSPRASGQGRGRGRGLRQGRGRGRAQCTLDLPDRAQARPRVRALAWLRQPLLAALSPERCLSAAAEESCARCLVHVLRLPAGHAGLARLDGRGSGLGAVLAALAQDRPLRFRRSGDSSRLLATAALMLAYGPLGLDAAAELVDPAAVVSAKLRQNPELARASPSGREAVGLIAALDRAARRVYRRDNAEPAAAAAAAAAEAALLGMAVWGAARAPAGREALAHRAARAVETIFAVVVPGAVRALAPHRRRDLTPTAAQEQRRHLDLLEGAVCAAWALSAGEVDGALVCDLAIHSARTSRRGREGALSRGTARRRA